MCCAVVASPRGLRVSIVPEYYCGATPLYFNKKKKKNAGCLPDHTSWYVKAPPRQRELAPDCFIHAAWDLCRILLSPLLVK